MKYIALGVSLLLPQILFAGLKWEPTKPQIPSPYSKKYITPTKKVSAEDWPLLADDLDLYGLKLVINRQLERFRGRTMSGTIQLGEKVYPLSKMRDSLSKLKELLQAQQLCQTKGLAPRRCQQEFFEQIKHHFDLYQPDVDSDRGFATFTAYYTPTLKGEKLPSTRFPHAVYKRPSEFLRKRYDREQIDFEGKLASKQLDLFYTNDLFEIYLLHVEGGGKVQLTDGQSFYLSYNGTNSKAWKFISLYMRDKGYIDDLSIKSQRRFLESNPQKAREIYATCPSYVFFKPSQRPPIGSDNVSLTDNRSIATDRNHYAMKGLISLVKTVRLREDYRENAETDPQESDFKPFTRLMLDQDTGGAIKGEARVDLYFGEDAYAAKASQYQHSKGELYFFMIK